MKGPEKENTGEGTGEGPENKADDDGLSEDMSFEQSLEELESLVDRLERGQLLLDESLELFEQGMKLARMCNRKLSRAERKIKVLIEENGRLRTDDLIEDE
ncbi:MAG: exodeoxyribonuclease VII small subunit [Methanosarcinaceae archaeon]|nr:exodeoxyribonuclease VII small subunit [Methanosarcinaceae archaeon]